LFVNGVFAAPPFRCLLIMTGQPDKIPRSRRELGPNLLSSNFDTLKRSRLDCIRCIRPRYIRGVFTAVVSTANLMSFWSGPAMT
jgi:hypothetical protein